MGWKVVFEEVELEGDVLDMMSFVERRAPKLRTGVGPGARWHFDEQDVLFGIIPKWLYLSEDRLLDRSKGLKSFDVLSWRIHVL